MPETNSIFPKCHFLGWDLPLCTRVSQWLWQHQCEPIADFSQWQIFVPTAESGRILRRALTESMPKGHRAFLSPSIQTPAQFFQSTLAGKPVLSKLEQELAWAQILRIAPPSIIETLFKQAPENDAEKRHWARKCAKEIISIRSLLAEADHDFQSVCQVAKVEKNRWALLSKLEAAYLEFIAKLEKSDPDNGWRELFRNSAEFPGISHWVFAGIPDPIPLLLHGIQQHPKILAKTTVLIGAPQDEQSNFDRWGRPLASHWTKTEIPEELLRGNRITTRDASETILALDQLITPTASPEKLWTVGCSDSTLEKDILHLGESRKIAFHQPKGLSLGTGEWPGLIKVWREWQLQDSSNQVVRLMSFPAIIRGYFPDIGERSLQLRRGLDNFLNKHLPSTLNQILSIPTPEQGWIPQLVRELDRDRKAIRESGDFSESFYRWIEKLLGDRELDRSGDLLEIAALETMQEWLSHWESSALTKDATAEEALASLEDTLNRTPCYPPKTEPCIDIAGWLELLWDPKPFLCFAHFNEGMVPESVVGDAYLPESMRLQVGLGNNEDRFARDAYIFRLILEQRRDAGKTHWIVGSQDNEGNSLKPSRLLFLCKDKGLPNRVLESIHPTTEPAPLPPKSKLWQLNPDYVELVEKESISVTEFRQYLTCPFRYFLRYRLKMEPHEESIGELDARAFGNLAHEVLFQLQANPEFAEIADTEKLKLATTQCLDSQIYKLYGSDLSLPIMLQRENLLGRLHTANEQIIEARRDGWKSVLAEWKFHKEHPGIKIGQWPLHGIIDLVERHEGSGMYRITDYKTSEKPTPPEKAHLHKLSPAAQAKSDWIASANFHYMGKPHRWIDLQLPLYCWVLREAFGATGQLCYFQLPRALNETGRNIWTDFDDEAMDSALQCAHEIVKCIQQGIFWPPGKASGPGGMEDWLDPKFDAWVNQGWIEKSQGGVS